MPKKPEVKFTSWSWSRLADYEECPFKAKLKHLDKMKEPGSSAMERGTQIHKLAENFATKQLTQLPDELKLFEDEFAVLRKSAKHLMVEQDWALSTAWTETKWFDSDARQAGLPLPWLRLRMDAALPKPKTRELRVIDHKTGKVRGEYTDQLELYATVAMSLMENVDKVSSELWFLDAGELIEKTFTRENLVALRAKWEKRIKPMFADRTFKPKPNEKCRWCWFGQSGKIKGGPGVCKF